MSDTEKPVVVKKPLSAYMQFCKVERGNLKAENPELTFGDLGRLLGKKWRSMDGDDKAEYVDAAETAKAEWVKANPDAKKGTKRKKSTKNAAGGPKVKRALSAYMFFAKENRSRIKEENPGATFGEIGKAVGAAWNEMDTEEREPYTESCNDDKLRYKKELSEATDKAEALAEAAKKKEEEEAAAESSGSDDASDGSDGSDGSDSDGSADDAADGDAAAEGAAAE